MHLVESSIGLSASNFAVGPVPSTAGTPVVIDAPGVTLLHIARATATGVEGALKSLRGRSAARRVVWANLGDLGTTSKIDWRQWGAKLVEQGGADVVVVCGAGGRDLALAARDAGLRLSRVIVCRDDATARNVLSDSLLSGDAVLAVGMTTDSCQRLAERLESKFERELVAG